MSESAFIVAVPEAEQIVGRFRSHYDPVAALGVPAHITVLYPFMAPESIDQSVQSDARSTLAEIPPFAFSLHRIERFPGVLYLAPEPASLFVALTNMLVARFPAYQPYGGSFGAVVPHLTVAHGSDQELVAVERDLAGAMTAGAVIRGVCSSVLLIENSSGRWRTMDSFMLAGER
jgi:2'-5' RNA ligase